MIYYATAMAITIVSAFFLTKSYELPNGLKAKSFKNFWIAFLVLLPLTFLAVFRWDVGVDSVYGGTYWEAYHAAAIGENAREFEPAFFALISFFSKHEVPFFWFLFVHGLLFMTGVSYAISKGSIWVTGSILVFFLLYIYFDSYSSLRQSLAESISLIALAYIGYFPPSKKKDVCILALFVIAALFHMIALFYIPIYLISKVRFSRNGMLKITIVFVALYPILQRVLGYVMRLVNGDQYSFVGVSMINAIMTLLIFLLCWYFYDSICAVDENAYIYVNISLLVFIVMLNSGALFLPYRCFDMLKISYIFIIPYLIKGIPKARTRLYVTIGLFSAFGLWFINAFFIQSSSASNYQTALADWDRIINLP